MSDNPIVDEVHRIRQEILAEYGGDIGALMKDMQRKTEEAARAGRKVVACPPRSDGLKVVDQKAS
jgi:hypothetical protein